MCPGWNVGGRRPAGDRRNSLIGEGKHFGLAGVLVAWNQHGLSLLRQSGDGNPLQALFLGYADSSIQAAQVHIGGNDERHPLKERVPNWYFGGLIFVLQSGLRQPVAVVRLCHNLKLNRSGVIAGEQMDRKQSLLPRLTIGNQTPLVSFILMFQLNQNGWVIVSRKEERPVKGTALRYTV